MVLMEDSRDKLSLLQDRDPEGLSNIVESSDILETSHIREVSDAQKPILLWSLQWWKTCWKNFIWDSRRPSVSLNSLVDSLVDFNRKKKLWSGWMTTYTNMLTSPILMLVQSAHPKLGTCKYLTNVAVWTSINLFSNVSTRASGSSVGWW